MIGNVIFWIVVGGLAGWLASIIMGANERQGALGNIMVGIAGAIIGGILSRALGGPTVTGFNVSSIIIATIGAVILLFFVGMFHRTASRH